MSETYEQRLKRLGKSEADTEAGAEKDSIIAKHKAGLDRIKGVAEAIADKVEKSILPRGSFAIPDLLDERRIEYSIPNGAFNTQPVFDRVFVYQVCEHDSVYYGDSSLILKTEHAQDVARRITPRGILVAAGLQAMDSLHSAGIELGHFIKFQKMSPFDMTIETVDGHDLKVMVMRDGDIVSSEDIATQLNTGACKVVNHSKDGYDFRILNKNNDGVTGKKNSPYYDQSM